MCVEVILNFLSCHKRDGNKSRKMKLSTSLWSCRLLKLTSVSCHHPEPEEERESCFKKHYCCKRDVPMGDDGREIEKVNVLRDNANHNQTEFWERQNCSSSTGSRLPSSSTCSKLFITLCCFLLVSSIVPTSVNAVGDPVYIRKVNGFLQLLSSDTLRWFKGVSKEPLKLMRPDLEPAVICRVWHTSLRGVGLVSEDQKVCNISTQEGVQGSDKYQTLSTTASRLVWKLWQRPNPPPLGAVAISFKPAKFLATNLNLTVIGYLDPTKNLGSGVFPNDPEPATSCLVLTEIEPDRIELSDVQLKRNKGFIEEDIVLAYGLLKYELPPTVEDVNPKSSHNWSGEEQAGESIHVKAESNEIGIWNSVVHSGGKGKVESILSYEINTLDAWGQGYLQAKGLHTIIKLKDGSTKVIEWGIPLTQSGKTETMTTVAELAPGTALNVSLRGIMVEGEQSYLSTLKTIFKDGSSSSRLLEGHRRIKDIQDIRLEHGKIFFLNNGSIVPDPTTTTTTTTTTTSTLSPHDGIEEEVDDDGEPRRENALPVESRNEFLADQGHNHGFGGGGENLPAASIAQSGAAGGTSNNPTSLFLTVLSTSLIVGVWMTLLSATSTSLHS